jgi:hypothetical protein
VRLSCSCARAVSHDHSKGCTSSLGWQPTSSIGQLNEVGYKIDIDAVMMKIWEPEDLVLVRVKCEANHLYLLHIKLTQPACFAVRRWGDEVAWL